MEFINGSLIFAQEALNWLVLLGWIYVPMLLGFLIALQAPPPVVRLLLGLTAFVSLGAAFGFFYPDRNGGWEALSNWFSCLVVGFEALLFLWGQGCGLWLRRWIRAESSVSSDR